MVSACFIRVQGTVQGVGFRPYVFRLAQSSQLTGWVLNAGHGVEIHIEGVEPALARFVEDLRSHAPSAADIATMEVRAAIPEGLGEFTIRESAARTALSTRISPDLPVCDACLEEMSDPQQRRFAYPYINCTQCGPRYSVIESLPYDRPRTSMKGWRMDSFCAGQYHNPDDRRFHAQPIACPECGPHFCLHHGSELTLGDAESIGRASALLRDGTIVALKGLGGYHLACDARNRAAVEALRKRKFRKEKPFAVMARDLPAAHSVAVLRPEEVRLLCSRARPIVLAAARIWLDGVAPDSGEVGVMLPYAPLHHLLFRAGAPGILVMTSANRSSEPIAYEDDDALARLSEIADAFLIGERPIVRRVDDSVARVCACGPMILRRARGYAPSPVVTLPARQPILAVGADLKNAITLVVEGQAFVSQHIGDLDHYESFRAFEQTVRDMTSMYEVPVRELLLVHDLHPQYASTAFALDFEGVPKRAVQHHRAHVASVLAERAKWNQHVLGIALDGTGFGDDGSIWGGELFVGSIAEGFTRVAHLRPAILPGGDAAARFPVQAAAGFLSQLSPAPDFASPPFAFPDRFRRSLELLDKGLRLFPTTSCGRLFDAAAALAGFTRKATFEGQAAMWLEQIARSVPAVEPYPFPFDGRQLDYRPLLGSIVQDRLDGRDPAAISRAFHGGMAKGLCDAARKLCRAHGLTTVALSGGVFQNSLLLGEVSRTLIERGFEVWTNHAVPPNDGGISLGQAALAAFCRTEPVSHA